MQKIILLIFMVFTILLGINGCKKETTVLDYPNVLLKVDLTPGEQEEQIAVFLYTTRTLMDYEIIEQGEDYKILKLNNTIKAMKTTELPIDGLEELIKNVRLIQDEQKNNKENPLVTKLVFKTLNPDVTFKIISQIKQIKPSEIQKKIDESPAAEAIAQSMKPPSNKIDIVIVIAFWVISLIGIGIYLIKVTLNRRKEAIALRLKKIISTEEETT